MAKIKSKPIDLKSADEPLPVGPKFTPKQQAIIARLKGNQAPRSIAREEGVCFHTVLELEATIRK